MTEINEASIRAEVRAWLGTNWNPDYGLVEWRHKLTEAGWGVPHWPSRWYGRDLPVGLVPVVEEEFKRIGAIGVARSAFAPWPPRRFLRTALICRRRSSYSAF
jgi:alkylation response protein AidB-like acyl-CoA dehydrogenase